MAFESFIPRGRLLVAGAGGFIGGHLVQALIDGGADSVRAIDIKPLSDWYQTPAEAEHISADLSDLDACRSSVKGVTTVYNLAADMGGMGFIENNRALCMLSVLINTHLLMAARDEVCERYFYASSACVYAAAKQDTTDPTPLVEGDAYPAQPEDGYGWEKLFSERMCRHFTEDFGIQTRVGRYHNVYGPLGTWSGGREKAPAAICRKVAEAVLSNNSEIEVWGDGNQSRSFTYISDCIEGTLRLTASEVKEPLNVGSDEMVTIDELADLVEEIAGVRLRRRYDFDAPQGVRGRSSDNSLIQELLGWAPATPLRSGMATTYQWVFDNVKVALASLAA